MLITLQASTEAKYRRETLDGREYLVVPTVLLVEGVFVGNEGPLYYGQEEFDDSAPSWNMKPIVLYHPQDEDGNFISAADKTQLEARQVGFLLNSRNDGRLVAEAWIDEAKAAKVDDRITKAILNGTPMEVSTGMVADVVMEEGEYNGIAYVGRAVNFRPDHFALLPDKKGACSLADGAGLLVMEDGVDPLLRSSVQSRASVMLANQMSHENLREALRRTLRAMLILDGTEYYPWIAEVYQTFLIAEIDGKLWKIGYSVNGDTVTIDTSVRPVEVVRVTEYKTLDGVFVGNQAPPTSTGELDVNKEEMIKLLITNGGYEETDREFLEKMDETKLNKLVVNIRKPEEKKTPKKDDEKPEQKLVTNEMSWDAFMNQAPPRYRQMITRGITVLNQQIQNDINTVLEGAGDMYSKEELEATDPEQLSKLARLVANSKKEEPEKEMEDDMALPAYYGGNVGSFPNHFIANSGQDTEEGLSLPSTFTS